MSGSYRSGGVEEKRPSKIVLPVGYAMTRIVVLSMNQKRVRQVIKFFLGLWMVPDIPHRDMILGFSNNAFYSKCSISIILLPLRSAHSRFEHGEWLPGTRAASEPLADADTSPKFFSGAHDSIGLIQRLGERDKTEAKIAAPSF